LSGLQGGGTFATIVGVGRAAAPIAIVVLAMVSACETSPPTASPVPPAAAHESSTPARETAPRAIPVVRHAAPSCRAGHEKDNVYHPDRLIVLASCVTVTGVVESVRHERDGDYHIDLNVDATFMPLLNATNASLQHGYLVTEIVPADESGCTVGQPPRPAAGTYDYGMCTGADLVAPPIGSYVSVTGPWVLDRDHGWNEIHPVWAWTLLRPASVSR
jgi:hypothetical protein